MTENDVATAVALKAQIDAIQAVQASIAEAGSAATIGVLGGTGNLDAPASKLGLALGDGEYDTQCANAKTALSTALADALTAAQAALTAL